MSESYEPFDLLAVLRFANYPEAADEIERLRARLATAEQIISYCASPTMAWNPSKGLIEEYVWVAPELLVRAALRAIIWNAQHFQREQP
jgi:hypothetical protein